MDDTGRIVREVKVASEPDLPADEIEPIERHPRSTNFEWSGSKSMVLLMPMSASKTPRPAVIKVDKTPAEPLAAIVRAG